MQQDFMIFSATMVSINLAVMFGGILGDPGIPDKIHKRLINDKLYDQAILDENLE